MDEQGQTRTDMDVMDGVDGMDGGGGMEGEYRRVAVGLIDEGDRRRAGVSVEETAEMETSVRAVGVLEPLLVTAKSLSAGYWLVAGYRRLVAARSVGLAEVPVIVIGTEVAEVARVTENLQRADLTPLEEAADLGRLLATGMTLEDAGDALGRSRAWIARRASLTNLTAAWRALIGDPKQAVSRWTAGHLELIARLPEAVQERVATEYALTLASDDGWRYDEVCRMTVAGLRRELTHYACALEGALWDLDDEGLVAEAGSCAACRARSDAQAELFEEEDWTDTDGQGRARTGNGARCLDAECFERKRWAWLTRRARELEAKHPGASVVFVGTGQAPAGVKLTPEYGVTGCKKSEACAVLCLRADGPKAGKEYWGKVLDRGSRDGRDGRDGQDLGDQRSEGDGGRTMEEKRAGLRKRRAKWILKQIDERLSGIVEGEMVAEVAHISGFDRLRLAAAFGTAENRSRPPAVGDFGGGWEEYDELAGEMGPDGEPDGISVNNVEDMLYYQACAVLRARLGWLLTLNPDVMPEQELQRCAEMSGLDWAALEGGAAAAIPEPKSWGKGKGKSEISDLKSQRADSQGTVGAVAASGRWRDAQGRELFVGTGIGGDDQWMTLYREGSGTHRVKSKALPIRGTRAEAQADLDAWAAKHGCERVVNEMDGHGRTRTDTDGHGRDGQSGRRKRASEQRGDER